MNIFGICKIGSIGCAIAGGVMGAVGAFPDLKDAINEYKDSKNTDPCDIIEANSKDVEGVEVTKF